MGHNTYDISNYTERDIEYMLEQWGVTQRFFYNEYTNQYYLINRQERTVTEIKNEEVTKFLYNQMYMSNVPSVFIDAFVNIGKFKMLEYC